MSIESLLIVALLLFPLLGRLIRYAREGAAGAAGTPAAPVGASGQGAPALPRLPTPDAATTTIAERAAERAGATGLAVPPAAPPPVVAPPALPPRHRAAARLTAGERVLAGRTMQAEQAARELGRAVSSGPRHAVLPRRAPADLRRAVVLMTILGPCQALENEAGRHRT